MDNSHVWECKLNCNSGPVYVGLQCDVHSVVFKLLDKDKVSFESTAINSEKVAASIIGSKNELNCKW